MCGISGILSSETFDRKDIMAAMLQRIAHRGPDAVGSFDEPAITLGHQRLAVIDIEHGAQPMLSPDRRHAIILNGEIYNFVELRRELVQAGEVFQTRSDTEVVLLAMRRWGKGALSRFRGMFAFAFWDSPNQTLLLARDRLGKKPLVYFFDGKTFAFASELKSLLSVPGCRPQIDPTAVDLYFSLGYVPAPSCIFKGVQKLQPGHSLEYRGGTIRIERYWHPEDVPERPREAHQDRLTSFRRIFAESVSMRLRSDIAIGIFLSGGIDSSAVAVEAAKQGARPHALTVSFDNEGTDLPFAALMAKRLSLSHDVVNITQDIEDALHAAAGCFDEPLADTSSIPSYLVAKASSSHFKVVLNGDGGDEAFAGYPHYRHIGIKQRLKSYAARAGLIEAQHSNFWQVYFKSKLLFEKDDRAALLSPHITPRDSLNAFLANDPYLGACRASSALKRALWADRHVALPNDLLHKMDMASSAFGMEGRSPFLDHVLMEWAQGIPDEELVNGTQLKAFLREALQDELPPEILHRKKHGFGSPIARWLRDPLQEAIHSFIPNPLLGHDMQTRIVSAFRSEGTERSAMRLWTLLTFSIWQRRWQATW